MQQEKNYAFLEFRSVEEASNCMAFDGVAFKETHLKIRRPNNYDINLAVLLGVVDPDPTMDLSKLDIVKTVVQDSPHKLFIGGLPCDWTEEQVCGVWCRALRKQQGVIAPSACCICMPGVGHEVWLTPVGPHR